MGVLSHTHHGPSIDDCLMTRPTPKSLCILRLSAIGDTCNLVPVVRTLRKAWPDTTITWIIGRTEHQLLAGIDVMVCPAMPAPAGPQADSPQTLPPPEIRPSGAR